MKISGIIASDHIAIDPDVVYICEKLSEYEMQ